MRNYLLLFLLLATSWAWGSPVEKETALQTAKTFMSQRTKKNASGMTLAYQSTRPRAVKGKTSSTRKANYFVFNNPDGGFVIVSGDDRTPAILGYSDEGSFDADNIPDNMAAWLQNYADQIDYLDTSDAQSLVSAPRKVPTLHAITPLLTSHWTQNAPFNNHLPVVSNTHVVVGCGATAMAQVMYYHRWPKATIEEIPGYTNRTQYYNEEKIVLDTIPAGTVFDWDNMIDTYTNKKGKETDAQKEAVAVLSKCCGVAVNMNYGLDGSSSSLSSFPKAFIKYFGYDSKVERKSRDSYDYDSWTHLLYNELLAGRPVIYAGQSTDTGHAFVIDGYDGEDLFHVNWGWNNGTDGFFLLSVLNPDDTSGTGASTSGTGYNFDQEAIIGLQPSSSDPGTPPSDETPLQLTFTIDSIIGNTVYGDYHNYTNVEKTFYLTLGYYDETGELKTCSSTNANTLPPGYYWHYKLNVNLTQPGRYIVFPMSRTSDSETWTPAPHGVTYIECIIDENGTRNLILHPIKALEATLSFTGPQYVGVNENVDITIKNIGEEFNDYLYLKAVNKDGEFSSSSALSIQLLAGKTMKAQASFTPTEAGNYDVTLSTDSEGKDVIARSSISITEGNFTTEEILQTKITVDGAIGNNVYGRKIKGTYTITNPTETLWTGDLRFFIYQSEERYSTYNSVQYINYSEAIQPGESVDIPFEYSGIYNDYYIIGMKYMQTYHEVGASDIYQLLPGFITYLSDGTTKSTPASGAITIDENVLAADFTGIDEDAVTSITPNSNPNTLYYFSEGTALTTKMTKSANNIVNELHSNAITLTDHYDFFIPMTFTASSISYNRTPELVSDGDEWESIALPFEVANVTVGGKTIDFYHSDQDTNKDFWVREYGEYDGMNMTFGKPERMKANVPYLIGFPASLKGKSVKFSGTNATLVSGIKIVSSSPYYSYVGTTTTIEKEQVYTLSDDGKKFTMKSKATIPPFRCYATANFEKDVPDSLPITTDAPVMLLGDVNGDGIVSITDVTLLVSHILGMHLEGIILSNGDMNGDNLYSVADVTALVALILNH